MKIVQVNIWTGRLKRSLKKFIKETDADVIIMQEAVWSGAENYDKVEADTRNFFVTLEQLKEINPEFKYDFRTADWGVKAFDGTNLHGMAILSRLPISETSTKLVHGELDMDTDINKNGYDHAYYVQKAKILDKKNNKFITIFNYHGYWLTDPMGDQETVRCMSEVANFIKLTDGPVVMTGDLNIVYESPAMRELDFLRDLTHEKGVKTTLTELGYDGDIACDHVLINEETKILNFEVLPDLISDHKALEFEIE